MIFKKKKKLEVKENPAGQVMLFSNSMEFTPKLSPKVQFEEGYQRNVIVYRAINEITTAIANIELEFHRGEEVLTSHPIADLLKRPNPAEGYDTFMTAVFTDYLATGEMFISALMGGGRPRELWRQSPQFMKITGGKSGLPLKYTFEGANGGKVVWDVDQLTGRSEMFYMKRYNPLDYWRGQSALMSSGLAIDCHNYGMQWNKSLLQNGARPSGFLKFAGNPSGETLGRLKELFKRRFQGAKNAGEIPVLIDGAEWQATDQSPRDMDYISSLKECTKYIASALGVPLPLIDNEASTFNNVEQAKERLYTDTVIPLLNCFLEQLNNWLEPYLGGAVIKINMDSIPALEKSRQIKFDRMIAAIDKGLITIDEARSELGYEPVGGMAETLLVQSGRIPLDMSGFEDLDQDEQEEVRSLKAAGFNRQEIAEIMEVKNAGALCAHTENVE